MNTDIKVRRIEIGDYAAIHRLNEQLGYDYNENKVCKRISSLLDSSSDIMLVVEYQGNVVGYAHGTPYETLYADELMNILAFVIQDKYDSIEDIANQLLARFESEAKHFGYNGVRMTANKERNQAEQFLSKHQFESHRDLKHYIKYFH
ncbi:MAG: GNAT family N-acetyltransferase, partial [Erysipelotrichaceae bacterium]